MLALLMPLAILAWSGAAVAQLQVTPNVEITPSTDTTPWIVQMAVAAGILGVLVVLALGLGYMRFAPKFFGREEIRKPPPGYRPPLLVREVAPSARAQAPSVRPSAAAGSSATASDTATAERPAAEAPAQGEEAAAEASSRATAGPQGEPAVQADAVGAAEAAAPEVRPEAKTAAEVGEPPEAAAPEGPPKAAAPEGPPEPSAAPPAAPRAASQGAGGATMDQETFDRVLEEQLAKGVDRRVAEGRARAAAVVAARKQAQG